MFGWKSKEDQKKELLAEIREDERRRLAAIAEAEEKARADEREKLKAAEKAREDEAVKMKASDAPWVIVKAGVQDPEKGIKIELDWNDAFIKHLRKNGYTGANDDAIIQKYIAILAQQVAADMGDDMINEHE